MAASRVNSGLCSITWISGFCSSHRHLLQIITALWLLLLVHGNSPPKPSSNGSRIIVSENTTINSVIGNITASDPDGQNLIFKTDTDETTQLVTLGTPRTPSDQPNTRVVDIILRSQLDRDYAPIQRNLYFTVSDGASSVPILITMFISDVNDVAPKFVNLPYEVTIKENTPNGTVVFSGVAAEDPDNGRGVLFTMESNAQAADEEYLTTFQINQYIGNITLIRPLDYEKHSYYQYKINAEDDGGLKADPAGFVVYVLDVQDTPPNFVNLPYSLQVDENVTLGTSIQKIVAVDGDRGLPNNITYTFLSGDYDNFQLDATTGVITVRKPLDRDSATMRNTGGVYAMVVKAAEVVPQGQENYGKTSATTLVTITVRDVNDNAPTFNQQNYVATIPENMQRGVPVAFQGDVMLVYDIDQGVNSHFYLTFQQNGQPYYDFSPLPQEIYSESSVLIRVNNSKSLDYEKNHVVVFQVVARELDTLEKRSSSATVTINIEDMNDNAPVFEKTDFTLSVMENTKIGTSVAQYTATDEDSGIYASITYSLRGGNGRFSIENSTGILRVASALDREENDNFYLTLEAQDGGGLRTPAEVVVTVLDMNDNTPVFKRDDYEGIVREGTTNFLRPLKVEAFDNDEANTNNSKVSYRIGIIPPSLSSNFTINSTTGQITITQLVDYEKLDPALKGVITLTVEAYDAGSPSLSSRVLVNISVEDMNDFAPVFTKAEYSITIPEDAQEGYPVFHVSATDYDATSPNNDLIYRIETGALDKFRINYTTGDVTVDKGAELDRESKDLYVLTISAVDRGTPPLTGSSTLKISLSDINDEPPVFQPVSQSVEIMENATLESPLIEFSAMDRDLNSLLEYSLGQVKAYGGNRADDPVNVTATGVELYFGINSSTGKIFVQNTLDRETAARVILEVIVRDTMATVGIQTATGTLTVRILDNNDNAPMFLPSSTYHVNVSEGDSVQSIVLQVSALDRDEAQTVSFSIGASTAPAFAISNDGTVRLISTLDRETSDTVVFQVIARDSGWPQLTSTATVSVTVLDINDNSPVFSPYNVTFNVSEDVSLGYLVAIFTATDRDIGDFGTVFYTLSGPDGVEGSFTIAGDSGRLNVTKLLDREKKSVYQLEVVASDSKNDPKNSRSSRSNMITIQVTDVDDNAPVFTRIIPETPEVPESLPVNQTVVTVMAEDADDPTTDNGLVLYYLTLATNATMKNSSQFFKMDSSTGIVTVAVPLKGSSGMYFITVLATNRKQKFKTLKQISIEILDVNDDIPRFIKPKVNNTVAYIMENSEKGTSVFQLEAVDEDKGPNGKIKYSIIPVPGNSKDGASIFSVDSDSGLITTNAEINAEVVDKYELKVEARDQGFPTPYSMTLTLVVMVLDRNDHKPEFIGYSVPHPISMEEGKFVCANINLAVDRDINKTAICYYLIGSSLMDTFVLKVDTGLLCLNQTLDRETTPVVDIVIQTLEDCFRSDIKTERIYPLVAGERYPPMYLPQNSDKLWIEIQVEDINDNPPRFHSKELALGVTRVTQYGKFILELKDDVEDADSPRWGVDYFEARSNFTAQPEALRQEIEGLGVVEPFRLFSNGSVKTNMYFKPQMSGFFLVDIVVFDKGGLFDTASLRISLINDDQRLIIVFRRTIENVAPFKDEIASYIGSKIGCRIVVDSIQTHETYMGADLSKTDMFIHGEDLETNEIIPAEKLLNLVDQKSAILMNLLNTYNIVQIIPSKKDTSGKEFEERLKMALILVSIILGSICLILAVVLFFVHRRYKRKLKAAKTIAYVNSGVEPDERDLYKTNLNGTKIHPYDNANPIFLDKIMLEYQEDGLEDHGYTGETTLDEQELTISSVGQVGSRQSNKAEIYLSAVIAEHELEEEGKLAETGPDSLANSTSTLQLSPIHVRFVNGHSKQYSS